MELLKQQDDYDRAQMVQKYLQANPHNEKPPNEKSLAARLCAKIHDIFRAIIEYLLINNESPNLTEPYLSLERSFSRLKLWSDGYGVSKGELDDVFARSRTVCRATLKLLASIGATLTERKFIPALQFKNR